MKRLYVIDTFDTKAPELQFAAISTRNAGVEVVLVDVSTQKSSGGADTEPATVASYHPEGEKAVLGLTDRGAAVAGMADALSAFLKTRDDVGGVLGLGGSGNTDLVTHAIRTLPIGTPKLMLSTVASGNTAPYFGPNDIAMMYSVVGIAGLNAISRRVIANAAHAVAGMVKGEIPSHESDKPAIGIDHVRRHNRFRNPGPQTP
ncbi:Tm-1-like ATP-binding domain-containing protein [Breoghania sp.]|uniref:Tm-1-like ATP-binding domain-containing protein n=1 Tax=Breoghania sp. TaxID=2065378 RepID=UPI0026168E45|nr:Tm-1-like ATP-binding domain-containing protein [Breoghania sp.]MDJ0933011.1 Tm-1-like ATP-binding domain-containing protein [Breoghania sp.]